MQIKHFDTLPEDAIFIRKEVFVKEQGFKNEFDERITRRIFLSDTKMAVLLQHAEFFMIRQKVSISLEELLF